MKEAATRLWNHEEQARVNSLKLISIIIIVTLANWVDRIQRPVLP